MAERLRILVVGSGGREHALAWKLSTSPSVDVVHVAPGNGGTDGEGIVNVKIAVDDFTNLVAHAKKHGLNLVVIGPEAPLVAGIEGYFKAVGIRCFGPSKAAAQMEGSKAFSKDFMQRHSIPTAAYRSFTEYESAKRYIDTISHSIVIKADGLAAGKGVIIPQTKEEADRALEKIMLEKEFGSAGSQVVIEEFLEGEELSILTFSDGYTIRSLPPAQDHKRAFDGDKGPNTGGMGCYAPTRVASPELIAQIDNTIVQPTIDCMRRDGIPFVGMLFTGLMITKDGPKVLEYNVRGGDPETQTLLPLLSDDTDLAKVIVACTEHWLDGVRLNVKPGFAATVVACSEGYPGSYAKNRPIALQQPASGRLVFHAGTAKDKQEKLISTGGRVIASTSTGESLEAAVSNAYDGMKSIKFEGMHFRKDIAHRAFAARTAKSTEAAMTYAAAGVSIDAGNSFVQRIKPYTKSTARPGANAIIGGFGGDLDLTRAGYNPKSPTIISAIDGVGTKLKIAHLMDIHDTVGIDLVAMNVNDLVVQGAEPLCFLDYYSCSTLDIDVAANFVKGVAEGCKISGCALVGGETAEMPGMYKGTEYDAAGCAIGAIDIPAGRIVLPDTASMVEDDVLLGLASNGLHSNGFSLVRRIIERSHLSFTDKAPWDHDISIGQSLLTPTRIYVKPLLNVVKKNLIKGMAHITGGGLFDNVPRMLPDQLSADIDVATWPRQPVFDWLQRAGHIDAKEIARTFNNGIGMVLVVSDAASGEVKRELEAHGEKAYRIGKLVRRGEDEGCILRNLDSWRSD